MGDHLHLAATGDITAQRALRDKAIELHGAGLGSGLDDALFWSRLIVTRGEPDDLTAYSVVLLRRIVRAQMMGDEQRRDELMAEAISVLDQRVDLGDASSMVALETLTSIASPDALEVAKAWRACDAGEGA